jgi:hypothetical protein
MDIQSIITEFKAYYLNSGQNTQRVKQLMLQPAVTPSYMTPIKTNDTVYQLGSSTITSLVQGFQKGWTPKGAVNFTPKVINLRKIKIDFEEYPDDLEATWLGFLASDSVNRKDWPFVKWLIENHIIPMMKQEMELAAYYKGVYQAPVADTPNTAADVLDGLGKLLQIGVDADTINYVANIGDLAASTVFDQTEAFVEGISPVYQTVNMNVFMAPEMARAYLKDKRSQGFYNLTSAQQIDNKIDFTPNQVIGLPSMAGTKRMFATPKANMLYCTKKDGNATNFKLEESKRQVFLMSDWYEGIGFGLDQVVWTSVPKTV